MTNKFATALKKKEQSIPTVFSENTPSYNEQFLKKQNIPLSRTGAKHIGGYFDPVVSKQLKTIALEEDSSVQALIAEALDMLFQSRGKPMIAEKIKSA
jgi:hypothetical protein